MPARRLRRPALDTFAVCSVARRSRRHLAAGAAASAGLRRLPQAIAVAGLALAPGAPDATPADTPVLAVRFAPEKDYGPFVFLDDTGTVRGLSVELLDLVQRRAALRVTTLPAAPLAEQLAAVRAGRAELLTSLRPTPERAEFLAFSQPYVSVPAVLVQRAHGAPVPSDRGLADLAGHAVAVGQDYAVEGFVRERFPQVGWVAVPDDVAALRGVVQGRYAAAVVDAASSAFIQRRHRLPGLQTAGPVGFEYRLSFAVPKHRQDLLLRLDEGIRAITAVERTAIVAHWLAPLEEAAGEASAWHGAATRLGLGLIGVAALAGLALALRPAATPRPTRNAPSTRSGP